MNARHLHETAEWYTPPHVVNMARKTLKHIDLDPASCDAANKIIQAKDIHTRESDGLKYDWIGNIFVNPPGGFVNDFWKKFVMEWMAGRMRNGIWIGYSLEQLQTLQGIASIHPLQFPICIPDRRISFVESPERKEQRESEGKKPTGPSHANYITYFGHDNLAFFDHFKSFGMTMPYSAIYQPQGAQRT